MWKRCGREEDRIRVRFWLSMTYKQTVLGDRRHHNGPPKVFIIVSLSRCLMSLHMDLYISDNSQLPANQHLIKLCW